MTTATELTRIIAAKAAIRSAIQAKGVTVPIIDTLEDYAAHIAAISGGGATAPAAFTAGQWTATAGNTQISLNITALPSDGGSAITALQYRLDGGAAVALSGVGTGVRTITGLSNATAYNVEIRAVNAIGSAAWSDVKARTPVAPSGAAAWEAVTSQAAAQNLTGAGNSPTKPAGSTASDLLVLVMSNVTLAARTAMTVPAGWTLIGESYAAFANLGHAMYWATGDTADAAWVSTVNLDVSIDIHRISGANLTTPVRVFAGRTTTADYNGELDDMPSPPATATAGDLVLAHYCQPQGTNLAGTPASGYTRRVGLNTPNTRSTLTRADVAAGSTGDITHTGNAPYQDRTSSTLVIASA